MPAASALGSAGLATSSSDDGFTSIVVTLDTEAEFQNINANAGSNQRCRTDEDRLLLNHMDLFLTHLLIKSATCQTSISSISCFLHI